MQRFVFLTLLIFSVASHAFAQDETMSKTETPGQGRSVQLMTHASYYYDDLYINPGLGFRKGKHALFAGPLMKQEFKSLPTVGWFAGYMFHPSFQYKRLSTFALVHVEQINKYTFFHTMHLHVGYGISIELIKNLFVDQSFSAGALAEWTDRDYQQRVGFEATLMVRAGLRYQLNL
jgi:hypothetical protein